MSATTTAAIIASGTLWRTLGVPAAGRRLIRALGSDDETIRTLAGMFLVKAGARSLVLLAEALDTRDNLSLVLTILGDIGEPRSIPMIEGFTQDRDADVARAAQDALKALRRRERS